MIVTVAVIVDTLSGWGPKGGKDLYDGDYVMDHVLNPLGSEIIYKEPVELEIMIAANSTLKQEL